MLKSKNYAYMKNEQGQRAQNGLHTKITHTSQKMDFIIAIYLKNISRIKIYQKLSKDLEKFLQHNK